MCNTNNIPLNVISHFMLCSLSDFFQFLLLILLRCIHHPRLHHRPFRCKRGISGHVWIQSKLGQCVNKQIDDSQLPLFPHQGSRAICLSFAIPFFFLHISVRITHGVLQRRRQVNIITIIVTYYLLFSCLRTKERVNS